MISYDYLSYKYNRIRGNYGIFKNNKKHTIWSE